MAEDVNVQGVKRFAIQVIMKSVFSVLSVAKFLFPIHLVREFDISKLFWMTGSQSEGG